MVYKDVDGDIAAQLQLDKEASDQLIEIGFQEPLKSWLRWQKQCRKAVQTGGRQLSAGFSLKCCLHERPLFRNSC